MTRPQKTFGRFQVTRVLGQGGMGTVYEAVDPVIGRKIAIKEIRADPAQTQAELAETRARFELEFRAAGTLSHPNIVTIYDVGQGGSSYFIAMEKVDGLSLADLLAIEPERPLDWVLDIATQIARGLDHAHEKGIIHRDVKPGNVLVTDDGHAKLTDFGLVKTMASDITTTGTLMGTPAFMSPEQVQGHRLDGRSDQFSFAVILYQMLTGRQPFRSEQPAAILYRIVHEDPKPPSHIQPLLPESADEVLGKALSKDPTARFPSCVALTESLRLAVGGATPRPLPAAPVKEGPRTLILRDGPATAAPTPRSRPRTAPATDPGSRSGARVVLVAVALLGLLAGFLLQRTGGARVAPGERGSTENLGATAAGPALPAAELRIGGAAYGARVLLDGRDTGLVVPAVLPLPGDPGTEAAVQLVDADGRALASRTFVLGPELPASWEPSVPVRVRVETEPTGAKLLRDGQELGTAPMDLLLDPAEEPTPAVEARLEGHRPATASIDLVALQAADAGERIVRLVLQPRPPPGAVAVRASYPVGARAGGRTWQPAAGLRLSLEPGSHAVELFAPEVFLRQTRTVEVHSGQTVTLDLPPTSRLHLRTHPEACKITIEGFDAGYAPFDRPVAVGPREVVFEWPAQGRSRTLRIDPAREPSAFVKLDG